MLFFEPLIPLGKDISVHKLRGKFSDPPTLCPYLVKGDAMNLTLIYNNVTSFPSRSLPMLSWFYVQDRYLSCSRTILGSRFHPYRKPMTPNNCIHFCMKGILKKICKNSLKNFRQLKTGRLKRSQFSFLFLSSENLKKMFYFFTYILIDYLLHEITKEF